MDLVPSKEGSVKERILFLAIVLISLPAVSRSSEYVHVMSKNDCLCEHMLKLYNADIGKYGEVKYQRHKEFNWINWEDKKISIVGAGGGIRDIDGKIAFFDINNDSKDEGIVYWESSLHNSPNDVYDVFNYDDVAILDETVDGPVYYKKRLLDFSSAGGRHPPVSNDDLSQEIVKKLPEKVRDCIEAGKKRGKKYAYFGNAPLKINFVRFRNRFLVAFEEISNAETLAMALDRFYREGGDPRTSSRSTEWLTEGFTDLTKYSWIAEVQKDNTLKTECLYFRNDSPAKIATAGFDCGKATSEVEKIICFDNELSGLDDSLNKAYQQALEQALFKKQIIRRQRQWLKEERNTCHDAACIKQAYESRIKELKFISSYVTIYSDGNVNLTHFQPLAEPFKAILAMYALQIGSHCKGGPDNLECEITSSLGLGTQCSKEQIGLVRKWFRKEIPKMGGYGDRLYKETQKLGNLEWICYKMPERPTYQETWNTIKVGIRKNLVFVDAVFYWTGGSGGPSGYTGYSTVYRIAKDRIITVSHKKVLDERDED